MNSQRKKEINIAFWEKDSGNHISHKLGLTAEQIEELQKLQPGDRLILFVNGFEGETQPSLNLKKMAAKVDDSSGGL